MSAGSLMISEQDDDQRSRRGGLRDGFDFDIRSANATPGMRSGADCRMVD